MGRIIGIRHRVKRTVEGEARPTQVAIVGGGKIEKIDLPDEQAELDFVLGRFPTKWRKVDDLSELERLREELPEHHVDERRNGIFVPALCNGLREGDSVAMVLGGSGDYLAFALSRHGQEVGASVFRVPSFVLKSERGNKEKQDDPETLALLLQEKAELFYPVTDRDLNLVRVRESLVARTDAMKARIACEQRLRQRVIGGIFCNPEGLVPEGLVEKQYDERKASDEILQALLSEEKARGRELTNAVEALDVYQQVFAPVEGCGPMIAARIIAAVIDIRRFERAPQLKKYCGVHVLDDGTFPRQRRGQVANWQPECRQALYLLAEQFNRRPRSEWGIKLRQYKANLRERHPDVKVEGGKKRYTNGHIHKMALWRVATRFVEHLHKKWWELERGAVKHEAAA